MLAHKKDNTNAKYCQKIRVLTMREQMLVSNESIRIQTRGKLEYRHVAKVFELLT